MKRTGTGLTLLVLTIILIVVVRGWFGTEEPTSVPQQTPSLFATSRAIPKNTGALTSSPDLVIETVEEAQYVAQFSKDVQNTRITVSLIKMDGSEPEFTQSNWRRRVFGRLEELCTAKASAEKATPPSKFAVIHHEWVRLTAELCSGKSPIETAIDGKSREGYRNGSESLAKLWALRYPMVAILEELPPPSPELAAAAQPSPTPTPATTPTPTPLPAPKWADGVALTEDSIRQALGAADPYWRSVDLESPKSIELGFNGFILLEYKIDSQRVWSETDLLTVAAHTTFRAMRVLFGNPEVNGVAVITLTDWVDPYGRTNEDKVTHSKFTRQIVDRIDWSGLGERVFLDNKLIFCISESQYVHPAIYRKLGDKGCLAN